MKIGKMLIAGIAITVFQTVVGMITCGWLFNWVYGLEPTNVWKPMDGPPGVTFYIGTLGLNIVLAFFYALFNKGIPGKSRLASCGIYDSRNSFGLLDN